MKYDIDDIALRVDAEKKKIKTTLVLCLFLVLSSVIIAVLIPETTIVFISAVVIVLSCVYFIRFLKLHNPIIIFSRGFRGENIKEHEYVTAGTRLTRYGGISYRYIPSRHKGDVYVRRNDGEVVVISHLPKKHLDIFEIGDTLVCYPGTRYPNVEGREVEEQPCPVCGYVNQNSDEKCNSCDLKIVKCK